MNALLNRILFITLLALGAFNFSHATAPLAIDSGGELIIIGKTGVAASFALPNKYIGKDGNLVLPATVTIEQNKQVLLVVDTKENNFQLPQVDLEQGSYYLTVQIGDYSQQVKVTK